MDYSPIGTYVCFDIGQKLTNQGVLYPVYLRLSWSKHFVRLFFFYGLDQSIGAILRIVHLRNCWTKTQQELDSIRNHLYRLAKVREDGTNKKTLDRLFKNIKKWEEGLLLQHKNIHSGNEKKKSEKVCSLS